MGTKQHPFFDEKKEAAIFKHALLGGYMQPFAGKAGSTSPSGRVVLLDGYSGPGKYADGSKGSPALMRETAERVAQFRDVQCIFVEQNKRAHRALVDEFGSDKSVWIPPAGSIEDHLDAALERAEGVPLLAFLDPFGLAMPFDVLTGKILARSEFLGGYRRGPITEVIMNFTVDGVRRVAGWLNTEPESPAVAKRQMKLLARLDSVFGGTWWREVWLRENPEERLDRVMDMWVGTLNDRGWNVIRVPVGRRWNGPPIYYLIFMTQSKEGVWSLLNAVSLANEKLYEYTHQGQLEIETQAERWNKWIQEIERNAVALLEKGDFMVGDKILELYGLTLGHARERHVRSAIKELHEWGVTPCDGKGKVLSMVVEQGSSPRPPVKKSGKASRPKSGRRVDAHPPWEFDPRPA